MDAVDELPKFKSLLDECRLYRCLISQLPEKVHFPMFEIGLLQVKTELKVEQMIFSLLSKLEQHI